MTAYFKILFNILQPYLRPFFFGKEKVICTLFPCVYQPCYKSGRLCCCFVKVAAE